MTEKEKLIKRIQGLLSLAEDEGSRSEAETAAKKAQELIMKYNVREAELRGGKAPKIEDTEYPVWRLAKPSEGNWLPSLFAVVAEYNFCEVLTVRRLVQGQGFRRKKFLIIIGEESNVEMIKYISEQLMHAFRRAYKKSWGEYCGYESYAVFKNGFFKGCYSGLDKKLAEQWQQYSEDESTGLIIRRNSLAVEEFLAENHPDVREGRAARISSQDGYEEGHHTGRSAHISPGLRGRDGSLLLNSETQGAA